MRIQTSQFQVNPWVPEYLRPDNPLVIIGSGRGRGKSYGICQYIVGRCMNEPNLRATIFRDFKSGAKDGALQLCRDIIDQHHFGGIAKSATSTDIRFPNGSIINVYGTDRRAENIKELESTDIAFCEEAQTMSKTAWQYLEPTIRKPGSQIIMAYNPTRSDDVVHQLFENPPPYAKTKFLTAADNLFPAPNNQRQEQFAKDSGDPSYNHVWLGEIRTVYGLIFKPERILIKNHADISQFYRGELIRSWDLAATDGDGDYTVGMLQSRLGSVENGYSFAILDVVRGQFAPDAVESLVLATAERDGTGTEIVMEQDPGSAGKTVAERYARILVSRGFRYHYERITGPKAARADGAAGAVNHGLYSMLEAEWNQPLLEEASHFSADPKSYRYDDQIDAWSTGFNRFTATYQPSQPYAVLNW